MEGGKWWALEGGKWLAVDKGTKLGCGTAFCAGWLASGAEVLASETPAYVKGGPLSICAANKADKTCAAHETSPPFTSDEAEAPLKYLRLLVLLSCS